MSTASASSRASTGTSSTPWRASRYRRPHGRRQPGRHHPGPHRALRQARPSTLPARFPQTPRELMTALSFVHRVCWPRETGDLPAGHGLLRREDLADPDLVRGAPAGRVRAGRLVGLHRRGAPLGRLPEASSATASPARWWRPRPSGRAPRPSATSSSSAASHPAAGRQRRPAAERPDQRGLDRRPGSSTCASGA